MVAIPVGWIPSGIWPDQVLGKHPASRSGENNGWVAEPPLARPGHGSALPGTCLGWPTPVGNDPQSSLMATQADRVRRPTAELSG